MQSGAEAAPHLPPPRHGRLPPSLFAARLIITTLAADISTAAFRFVSVIPAADFSSDPAAAHIMMMTAGALLSKAPNNVPISAIFASENGFRRDLTGLLTLGESRVTSRGRGRR